MKTSVSLLPWAFEGLWLLMLLRMVYIFSPRWNFAPPCTRWQSIEHNIARVRLKATVYYRHIEVDLILTPHMSNVTEQSFSASPSARAFTIRTLETSALKFSTTLTLLLSSWNTITGSVGISTKKWNEKVKTANPPMTRTHIPPKGEKTMKRSPMYLTSVITNNGTACWQLAIIMMVPLYRENVTCRMLSKGLVIFPWAVTRVGCNQSLFSQSVSQSVELGLARTGASKWTEKGTGERHLCLPRSHALYRATVLPEGVLEVFCVVIWLKMIKARKQFLI